MSRNYVLLILMLLSAILGFMLKPTDHIAVHGPKIDLEKMIPENFGEWKIDKSVAPIQVDPQRLKLLKTIYSQTLSRTYVNTHGEFVMLSIAYGGDQSDSMQVHKPEICYPAQGFQMLDIQIGSLSTGYGDIPVKRMLARMGNRLEPITYWITIGDTVAVNSLKWKLAQLKYGLTGKVPDGLIFRVSSIGAPSDAYPIQDEFVKTLLKSVNTNQRERLIGKATL